MSRYLAAAAALAAASVLGAKEFSCRGVVQSPLDQGEIIIAHEPVPGFMPAMTMPFVVAPSEPSARGLRRGDVVEFTFSTEPGRSHASQFRRVGHDASLDDTASAPARTHPGGREFPAFRLVDQTGAAVTPQDFAGKLTVVTLAEAPGTAELPPELAAKLRGLEASASDWQSGGPAPLQLITILCGDAGPRAADVARRYGAAAPGWKILSAPEPAASELLRSLGAPAQPRRTGGTLITAAVDANGRVAGIWTGGSWSAAEVMAALRPGSDRVEAAR